MSTFIIKDKIFNNIAFNQEMTNLVVMIVVVRFQLQIVQLGLHLPLRCLEVRARITFSEWLVVNCLNIEVVLIPQFHHGRQCDRLVPLKSTIT